MRPTRGRSKYKTTPATGALPRPSGSFVTALRLKDWTAKWLQPQAASQQPDVVTYVRTVVTPPPGALQRATAFISAAHTYQLFVDGNRVDFGPSFSYPDEQYVRSVDLTGQIPAGRGNRTRCAASVVWRWSGSSALGSRSHRRALTDLHRWSAGGVRDGRHVERASGGMAPLSPAQFRWCRLR